jgi:hypothetical protein
MKRLEKNPKKYQRVADEYLKILDIKPEITKLN